MRTAAILPIKSFGAAKQRLSPMLGGGARQALAQAMFSDVLSSLRKVERLDTITVVSADATVDAAARGHGVTVVGDPRESGQSDATLLGIRHALASGYDRVLLVPGDTPLLCPSEIDALLGRGEADGMQVVIVPDRHGSGTNALVISPPDAFRPSFGPDSLNRHVTLAQEAGLKHSVEEVPSLSHDVDTPDDLESLAAVLEERRAVAPLTRGALRQLDRVRSSRFSAAEPVEV
ncbi:MAG TPA: 2-phospho-L-lactate guanylyltransferase [Thermoleophilaceae bacterium]